MSRENGRVADGGSGDGWGEGPGRGVSGITGGTLAGGCPGGGSLARRVPDLGLLEVLLAVDRLGSLGRAARELGITQPAASGRVRSLERQLGVGLVARSPRGSRLTPTGLLVAGWARRVTEAAEAFDAGARALRGRRDSRLRVAASMTIGEYLLPGWLVALRAVRPDTAVSLRAGSTRMVVEGLLDGEADLGFVEGLGVPAGTDGAVIARDRLLVLVRPGHPVDRAHRRPRPRAPRHDAADPARGGLGHARGPGRRARPVRRARAPPARTVLDDRAEVGGAERCGPGGAERAGRG
ncbi:DNA-binding transcriptional regulator, LysR family, partial [Streptomyces sp. SolWspMP-sol7th]